MKNLQHIVYERVEFIRNLLKESGASGIVYGNSGGKDCCLVGILCRLATENVLGVIMPAGSKRNYEQDRNDALLVSQQFNIPCTEVDLGETRNTILSAIEKVVPLETGASSNIAPRLRMTVLYAIARQKNYLVAGTGNRSENHMGYFTKHGDGAYDFNCISDLTVTEIYDILRFLRAPSQIVDKAPSGGLYDGQTDEGEMGVSYAAIDRYILSGQGEESDIEKITKAHKSSHHKRNGSINFRHPK